MAVSSKKDKLIEEAQKFSLRGQFDKAAKVYEQILALEPTAINLRQKLAELLIKSGRNEDARKELETIGKHFTKNGFYLKAIAVYKQLQKLFPADISLSFTLAELNEKHGLVANSLSEYKLVYEFHDKSGNIPEALQILERMQNVDPQNISITIKLAEAYNKSGKKDESYSVFSNAASVFLERGDNTALSQICNRIKQLFPDKPDFLLEALSEQIRQGNAASAIESIQGFLRSNPKNKRAWDLVILAYQQLEQPQRVKIAYQHYLKFFPSEPVAMLGLISTITAERNLAAALDLLVLYEADLISAGFLQELGQVYQSLEKIDPINTGIMEGLIRVAAANGNDKEVHALTSRLKSLRSVSGKASEEEIKPKPAPAPFEPPPSTLPETKDSPFFDKTSSAQPAPFLLPPLVTEGSAEVKSVVPINTAIMPPPQLDEEIEIEIEIDDSSPFDSLEEDLSESSVHGNWLDSVGDLFDTINTAPSGVKYGNEMDSSDAQSHFDLGQAFKEMGLYDEAIIEFRQASQDESRRVECLTMQCACLRERGELEKATAMLLALLKTGLSKDESCAVKYELASAYESAGNKDAANILLNEINSSNPGFRDINSRLNAANISDSLDFSDDDLKDF